MSRSIAALVAAASLLGITMVASTVTAQEEPPSPEPTFTSSGTVELELVDQSFDLGPDGEIELTYRLTGDLAAVADLSPPATSTTTTTTTSTSTTTIAEPTATNAPEEAPPPASPTAPPATNSPTTTTTTTTTTLPPPPVPLTVSVLNYEPIDDPQDLQGILGSNPRSPRISDQFFIDGVGFLDGRVLIDVESTTLATLHITVPTDTDPSVAERLKFDDDGIHPIVVQVSADGQVVARHGTVVEHRSSHVTTPPPIDLAFVASIDDPGPTADDGALTDAVDELEAFIDIAEVIDAPLTFAIPPAVAAAAVRSGLPDADAETLLDEEVLAAPATPFDVSSAVAVDRVDAFVRQLQAGEDDMRELLDVVTVRDVWLATEPLSAAGAQVLRDLGVRYLAMPRDIYAETIGDGNRGLPDRDRFVELDLPNGSTIPTLLIDDQFGAAFEASRTDEILAEQTPTEWAVDTIATWRVAQYASSRIERRDRLSRLVAVPGLGTFDPTLVVALETFGASTDAVRFTPASALAGVTDTQTAPVDAALPDTAGPSLEARLERIAAVEADLADTASMLLDDDPRPAQWARRLDSVVSTAFTDAEVDTELDRLLADAVRIRGGVVPPDPFTFTLTGREVQRIELRIDNILDEELQVLLRLRSPRLSFPEGEMIVTLAADDTTVVDVPVIARSNGTSAVTVEILTPLEQRPLIEPVRLTSRVNSLTGLGRLLTAALILILATWWISSWRSKRRTRDGAMVASPAAGTDPSPVE